MPQRAVLCFFNEILAARAEAGELVAIGRFSREIGGAPLYLADVDGEPIAVCHPGVGAPLAAHHLENLIASGCRAFVACGAAGAVAAGLNADHIVIPTGAVRDEGTSFHYLPASRTVDADTDAVAVALSVLAELDIPHTLGLTWTTDAPLRETPLRIERRRDEGCLTVEMEAAALFAIAAHRGVRFVQYLYAADDLSGPVWAHRDWTTSSAREALLDIALTTARRL
jgi:uridine phosphorylase